MEFCSFLSSLDECEKDFDSFEVSGRVAEYVEKSDSILGDIRVQPPESETATIHRQMGLFK